MTVCHESTTQERVVIPLCERQIRRISVFVPVQKRDAQLNQAGYSVVFIALTVFKRNASMLQQAP